VFEEDYESNDESTMGKTTMGTFDPSELLPVPPHKQAESINASTIEVVTGLAIYWERLWQTELMVLVAASKQPEFLDRLVEVLEYAPEVWTDAYLNLCNPAIVAVRRLLQYHQQSDCENSVVSLLLPSVSKLVELGTSIFTAYTIHPLRPPVEVEYTGVLLLDSVLQELCTSLGLLFALSARNAESPLGDGGVLSLSDKWCCASLLVAVLKGPDHSTSESAPRTSVWVPALRALGQVIAHAALDGLNMLLALQLPAALFTCFLHFDYRHLEAALSADGDTSGLQVLVYSLEDMALLLHPVGGQWRGGSFATPLEDILNQKSSSDGDVFSLASERVALRFRVAQGLGDKFAEGLEKGYTHLLRILLLVLVPRTSGNRVKELDILRSSTLRVVYQLTSPTLSSSNAIDTKFISNLLDAVCCFIDSMLPPIHEQDSLSAGLGLLVLSNLVLSNRLTANQLQSCVRSVNEMISQEDDLRVLSAAFRTTSSLLTCGVPFKDPSQHNKIVDLIYKSLNDVVLNAARLLLAYHPSKGRDPEWLTGCQYGPRPERLLDGLLCVLALAGAARHRQVLTFEMAALVCRQIHSAGHGEISPVGLAAALLFMDSFFSLHGFILFSHCLSWP
jgi:hypothetical protein